MREKKYIKLKCDMYEDTKFKIIDTMEARDTINYIWTRILTLCGKINNSEGKLLISKNMRYTIEILALEFNRSVEQVENAINVFIDLNMMSKDEKGVFTVCNFNKHQGCKKHKEDNNEVQKGEASLENQNDNINNLNNDKFESSNTYKEFNKNGEDKNNKTSKDFKNQISRYKNSFESINVGKTKNKLGRIEDLKGKIGELSINEDLEAISS